MNTKTKSNPNERHATIKLGIDHARFIKKFQGLDYRLTGVEPSKVVKGILTETAPELIVGKQNLASVPKSGTLHE